MFISSRIFVEKQSSIHHTSALANSSLLIGKTSFLLLLPGGHQWQDMKKDQGNSQGQLGDMHGGKINYPWLVIFCDNLKRPICPFCIICYKKRENEHPPEMTNPYGTKGRNHRFTDCLWNRLIEDCELKAATHLFAFIFHIILFNPASELHTNIKERKQSLIPEPFLY